ncbi:hypothetical protein F5Y15DRAFT_141209 [Xylariaceae sp. FL0016]|nr:hypothetical protein F5Y15DRAFT_141209 [Xylariaceae sp. FL0016]
MSADLFAAFDDFSQPNPQQTQPKRPAQPPPTQPNPFSFLSTSSTFSPQIPTNPQWLTSPSDPVSQSPWSQTNISQWSGSSNTTAFPNVSLKPDISNDEDVDDGWGDFEVAPSTTQAPAKPAKPAPPPSVNSISKASRMPPPTTRNRIVRAPTIDLITNNLIDSPGSTAVQGHVAKSSWVQNQSSYTQQPKEPHHIANQQKAVKSDFKKDPNVLFDADDFDGNEDDDFGEFESVASPSHPLPDLLSNTTLMAPANTEKKASQMLLGLDLNEATPTYPQAPVSPSFHDRNPFPGLALATPTEPKKAEESKTKSTPLTAWPGAESAASASDGLDDWGAFDDFPDDMPDSKPKSAGGTWDWDSTEPSKLAKQSKVVAAVKSAPSIDQKPRQSADIHESSWDWDSGETDENVIQSVDDGLPPINIPPPSILLSVFPGLFDQANSALYKPVSGQPFSVKNRILSDPKTLDFLKGYLNLAVVAARIITGRKLRWHRDKYLSQSMSISAAGSKGMKLAGVDKAQTAREDREAADVVSHWKENVGRLRSAIAAANSTAKSPGQQLKMPEIAETMPIQTDKGAPGAPKACVICGLKRNERIPKVDHDVEDSFGEWWVDHWGHLACKRFWVQHENTLRQR